MVFRLLHFIMYLNDVPKTVMLRQLDLLSFKIKHSFGFSMQLSEIYISNYNLALYLVSYSLHFLILTFMNHWCLQPNKNCTHNGLLLLLFLFYFYKPPWLVSLSSNANVILVVSIPKCEHKFKKDSNQLNIFLSKPINNIFILCLIKAGFYEFISFVVLFNHYCL